MQLATRGMPALHVETLEQIKARVESLFPGAQLEIIPNGSAAGQPSLLVDNDHAVAVARFLCEDPQLRLDYVSNVTGVDWQHTTFNQPVKLIKVIDGVEQEVEETLVRKRPGYLEAVYHLYSMSLGHGPVILRLRTQNRSNRVNLPSLTPVWRGAEFQEREIFDLFGIRFEGHPDLRRLLMWETYQFHPMRKDFVEPDDYEYEPTPHDVVLEKTRRHDPPGCVA